MAGIIIAPRPGCTRIAYCATRPRFLVVAALLDAFYTSRVVNAAGSLRSVSSFNGFACVRALACDICSLLRLDGYLDLGLGYDRNSTPVRILDRRLPYRRGAADMQRNRNPRQRRSSSLGKKIGFRFDGSTAMPGRAVGNRAAGAEHVAERHHRAAIHIAPLVEVHRRNGQLADDFLAADRNQANAERARHAAKHHRAVCARARVDFFVCRIDLFMRVLQKKWAQRYPQRDRAGLLLRLTPKPAVLGFSD